MNILTRLDYLIGFVFVVFITAQNVLSDANACSAIFSCGNCLRNPNCAWCKQENYDYSHRCDFASNLLEKCDAQHVVNPENEINLLQDKKLTEHGQEDGERVQLAPQHVSLKLRPGSPYNLSVIFQSANDHPIDLYFLMDLSKTMEDDKQTLALLADELIDRMHRVSSNYRIGFGSFVDKPVMPFVNTLPEKLLEPCPGCAPPYSFRNHLSLTAETNQFRTTVASARISGNIDSPEGGFDGIVQSIVCHKEIGWRNHSRKFLVMLTDAVFHIAGDGKLAGIVKPNDGECHLDQNGMYTHSTLMDYPSISQLNRTAKEKNVSIIFAVPKNQMNVYERLSKHIKGSVVGEVADDSSNIIDVILRELYKTASDVELKNSEIENLSVSYYSKCLDKNFEETNFCGALKAGSIVEFVIEIKLESCPKNFKDWKQQLIINPLGFDESLTVSIDMICQCDCEKDENKEENSPKCNGSSYECGICNCKPNRYGRYCECDKSITREDSCTM